MPLAAQQNAGNRSPSTDPEFLRVPADDPSEASCSTDSVAACLA